MKKTQLIGMKSQKSGGDKLERNLHQYHSLPSKILSLTGYPFHSFVSAVSVLGISPKRFLKHTRSRDMASDKKADSSVSEDVGVNHVKLFGHQLVGRKVKIWWPQKKMFHKGKITHFNDEERMHMIVYDDDITELVELSKEHWQLVKEKGSGPDPSNAAKG